jgi:hypothetical protein
MRAYKRKPLLFVGTVIVLWSLPATICSAENLPYTTYASFDELLRGSGRYPALTRASDPGSSAHKAYTGFFFYQCLQFDSTSRYLLGMKVYFQNRVVEPTDRGDIGYFDLKEGYKWTKIGETTAWNRQHGARLQWRPKSDGIIWNDRSDDGKKYVWGVHNFRTGEKRTLPRPIYELSPDGSTALTHDFERMKHRGTNYVGIEDPYKNQHAPRVLSS